jgi:dihydroorotate dehydrogenase electron transfer subunit
MPSPPARRPLLPLALRVRRAIPENERTKTIVLDGAVDARPGQFGMLWLPGLDEKPFSLLDAAPLAFTIAAVGPFSRAVCRLAPGDTVWFRGPFGHGFQPRGADHLLVGGGYGVAPLLFLARRLRAGGGRVRAVIGARTAAELLHVEPFQAIGAAVHCTTEDGSAGTRGLATDAVAALLATDRPDRLYACGPPGMLAALGDLAHGHALPAQLSWEAYMRCGLGLCGSCEHAGMLLCVDGPVLEGTR